MGHLGQGADRQVFRLHPGGDVEGIGVLLAGKAHLRSDGGLLGHGDGHRVVCMGGSRIIGDGGIPLDGCDDQGAVLIYRLDGQLGAGVGNPAVRPHQHGLRPGGADKLVQQRAAALLLRPVQLVHQLVHLCRQVVGDHCGVGAGGGPGDEPEGDRPGGEQDQQGDEKHPGGEALTQLPWQHGSPPPSPSRYSPAPACGAGF